MPTVETLFTQLWSLALEAQTIGTRPSAEDGR